MKYNKNDLYKDCDKDINAQPICVNCGENHPANYIGCKHIKYANNKGNRNQWEIQETTKPNQTHPNPPVRSYSEAVIPNEHPISWLDQFLNVLKTLITSFLEQK